MALKGSLDTFGMTDVLSLLAMTNKTGDLRLRRAQAGVTVSGYVRLRDGVVVAASADEERQLLARQLIVSGLISDEAFGEAVDSGAVGDALARRLAVAAGLDAGAVSGLSHAQVLNAVFELLRWPDGDFTFEVSSPVPCALDASITVEQAVAEGGARLAAWPALTAAIPAASSVLAVTVAVEGEAVLSAAEWGVLGLFDGHRTVAEALVLSSSGEWETVSLLAGLLERGLVVPSADRSSAAHRAELLSRIGLYAAPVQAAAAPAVVPAQAVSHDRIFVEVPAVAPGGFESLASGASALESALEAAGDVTTVSDEPGDGVDEALLQQLIAGVRAL